MRQSRAALAFLALLVAAIGAAANTFAIRDAVLVAKGHHAYTLESDNTDYRVVPGGFRDPLAKLRTGAHVAITVEASKLWVIVYRPRRSNKEFRYKIIGSDRTAHPHPTTPFKGRI